MVETDDPHVIPWQLLRFEHVARLVAEMRDRGYRPATVNLRLAALKGVARTAWRMGLLEGEAYARIADVKGVKAKRLPAGRAISTGELRALLGRAASDPTPIGRRDAAILALLFGGGFRRAEVVGLNLEDLDLEAGTIRVIGKGDKEELQPLPAGVLAYLRDYVAIRGPEPGPLLVAVLRGGHVRHRRLNDQLIADVLARRAREAGVDRLRPHDARRTFVTGVIDSTGGDLNAARMLARHESVSTTQSYDMRGDRAKRAAADTVTIPYFGVRR
jgi:site-specific recombinase XerC